MTLRVAVAGGNGRMGQTLVELVETADDLLLVAVTLAPGEDVPASTVVDRELYTHDAADAISRADVLIDFTSPGTVAAGARSRCGDEERRVPGGQL